MNLSLSLKGLFPKILDSRLNYYLLVIFLALLIGVVISFGVLVLHKHYSLALSYFHFFLYSIDRKVFAIYY